MSTKGDSAGTLFLLDNFDSFSYNLVDEFRTQGYNIIVFRNNVPAKKIVEHMQASSQTQALILSPGPGTPSEAGCMAELIKLTVGQFPILGICLGHQAIVEHYGGKIVRAPNVMHGKASSIEHTGEYMFSKLSNPIPVARYHSLMAAELPNTLELLAWYDSIPMAVFHKEHKALGFQFHPESILTTYGSHLLAQSLDFLLDDKT